MNDRSLIAWRVLIVATVGVVLFGFVLVVLPQLSIRAFSLLTYSSSTHLESFGAEAAEYIKLAHAVLGAVMIGWGVLFLFIVLGPLRRRSTEASSMFVASLLAWYVPDTAYSLLSGFWHNAVLNTVLAVLLAVPLWVLWSGSRDRPPA